MINLRKKIYIILLLVLILGVLIRQSLVRRERSKEIISTISQWQEYGKPVTVREIKKEMVREYARFPVTVGPDGIASGFVTRDLQEKLRQGQEMYPEDQSLDPIGVISGISREMDVDTGMFYVQGEAAVPVTAEQGVVVVYVHTNTYQDAIAVPNEILEIEGNDFFLWKTEQGRAQRVKVEIGSRNGYGAIIISGLEEGDQLICSGQSQLREGDKVRTVTMKHCAPGAAQEVKQ